MRAALLLLTGLWPAIVPAQDGRTLMELAQQRYTPPPQVYQELALVMSDAQERYSVRTFRHYGRQGKHLLVVETPADLQGVRIHLNQTQTGEERTAPASPILGSNFQVGDFAAEAFDAYDYVRRDNEPLDRQPHYIVEALPRQPGLSARRLYLRQDNLFISRIDYRDSAGKPERRQTFRDPRPDEAGIWRAGMILMEDLRDGRRSLLKVERRIHSSDYPPDTRVARQP